MIRIEHHDAPALKRPAFTVDGELNHKMNQYPLLANLNRNFCASFLGKAGSGKTSLLCSFMQSKNVFKRVFSKIIVFCPQYSRASMKKCIWDCLPPGQVFDDLTPDNISKAMGMVEANRELGQTLIVFDDVQMAYKNVHVQPFLLRMQSNRRHLHLSMAIIAQSYRKIDRQFRSGFSDVFAFRLSKGDYADMFEELVTVPKHAWENIVQSYRRNDLEHNFIYISVTMQKYFIGYDEVVVVEDEENDLEQQCAMAMDDADDANDANNANAADRDHHH